MKAQGDESGGRILLSDNTDGRAVMLQLCWSLDFNWTLLYIHIYLTECILNSELRKIPLAPDFLARNYCVSRGVSVYFLQLSH